MPTAAVQLRELHQLLLQREEVQGKIERGPRRIAASRKRAEEREAARDELKQSLQKLKMGGDQKSLQLKTNESKIVDLKVKLNQASTNREFDLIKGQIEADEMANSVLEDEILEVYEKVDQLEAEIAAAEDECRQAREDEKKVAESVAAAIDGLKREAEELAASVREAETGLADNVVEKYRRLVGAHGAGALASATSVCSACYVELEPQSQVELKAGRSVFCRNCGRLLYRDADE